MDLFSLSAKIKLDSSEYESGLKASESKFNQFGSKMSSWAIAKGQLVADFAKKCASSVKNIISSSLSEGMSFDSSMSQVAATMGKTMKQLNKETGTVETSFGKFTGNLSEYARFMGANTAFSATEAANALNYMALAGYNTNQSMQMLPNVLNLAAAGGVELARASDMVTDAQSALGLSFEQTNELVDQMAKTSSKTNTSVEQLGDAILSIGAAGKDLKGGTAELNTVLGVLANNGIKGSYAGTKLRSILTHLGSPAKEAAKYFEELGLDVYDVNGKMREVPEIFNDLNKSLKGKTDEEKNTILKKMFGEDNITAIKALLATTGDQWEELQQQITDSEGAAAKMAKTQLDNLEGDVTKFNSALGEAKIALSEKLTPTLRKFVQFGTKSLDKVTTAFKKKGLGGAIKELDKQIGAGIKKLKKSDSPVLKTFGNILDGVRKWIKIIETSFSNFPKAIKMAWERIKQGVSNLGGLIFGKNEKGEVKWPTWDDVKDFAKKAWKKIKKAAISLGNEFGKLVFGTDEKGDVKWPTWDEVKEYAKQKWEDIKKAAITLGNDFGKLIFGTNEKGDVKWPTWDDVLEYAKQAWEDIKTAASTLGTEFGKLVFGTTEKGDVKWPTWGEVKVGAENFWKEVKKNVKNIAKTLGGLVFGKNKDGSVAWPRWRDVRWKAQQLWAEIKEKAKSLKGLVFGDAKDAGSVFDGIRESWETLRSTIEGNAIKIASYFFDEADPEKVANAIKTIGDVIVGLATGVGVYLAVTRFQKIIESIKSLFTLGVGTNKTAIILAAIATAITLVAENWDKVEPILTSIGEWVDENIVKPFQNAVEWIKEAIKEIKRFLNIGTNEREGETTLTLGEADKLKVGYKMLQASKKGLDTPVPMSDDIFYTKLRETLEGAGKSAEEIESIVEQIKSSDDPEWVLAFIESLTSAKKEVSGVKEQVDGLPTDKTLNYHILLDDPDGVLSPSETHTPGTQGKIPGKAKGDWNVPYDNYLASLHRGEMVLTASQARAYREGNTGVDMSGMKAEIISAIKEGMANVVVRSFLNGKDITEEVNRNNMRDVKGRRFAT